MATSVQDKSITRFDCVVPMKLVVAAKEAMEKYSASAKDEDFDEEGSDDAAGKEEGGDEDSGAEKPKADEDEGGGQ
jgi:hypothetical protein